MTAKGWIVFCMLISFSAPTAVIFSLKHCIFVCMFVVWIFSCLTVIFGIPLTLCFRERKTFVLTLTLLAAFTGRSVDFWACFTLDKLSHLQSIFGT